LLLKFWKTEGSFSRSPLLKTWKKKQLNYFDAMCYFQQQVGLRYGEILEIGMISGN
jgi:hypothetical protein